MIISIQLNFSQRELAVLRQGHEVLVAYLSRLTESSHFLLCAKG